MKDILNNRNESSNVIEKKIKSMNAWLIVLIIYLVLFTIVAYLAFVNIELLPPLNELKPFITMEDSEFKTFFLNALKTEDSERANRQNLATQSFNVVLGAVLGFLSASATFMNKNNNQK